MSNTFQCTQCGLCCVGLNIPLSVNEALLWIARGNRVKILVEAIPWVTDQVLLSDSLERKETITFTVERSLFDFKSHWWPTSVKLAPI